MLITLCYVYLWVRFHKCYSVLIRNSLSRLSSGSFGFSFGVCSSSAAASPTGRHTAALRRPGVLPAGDNVFLQLGDKAVYVTQPQVGYSRWLYIGMMSQPGLCGPEIAGACRCLRFSLSSRASRKQTAGQEARLQQCTCACTSSSSTICYKSCILKPY